jgi:plastocyanin
VRKLVLWACVGLAGAGVAILPSLGSAQGTTASFTAVDNGTFFSVPTWSANGTAASTVTITPGGTVTFAYPTGSSIHSVVFTGAQPSSCTQDSAPYPYTIQPAPPLPYTPEGPAWSGSCRFDTAGTYPFQDGYRGTAMSGTVTVAVPTTTPPPTTTTQTTTGTTTQTFHEPAIPAASSSLRAAAVQRGTTVRGQIHVTAPGSRIVADLLIGRTRVGRTTIHGVRNGTRHFSVSLYASTARRLRRSGRLTVSLSVQVLSIGLGPTVLSRHVALVA